MDNQTKIPNRLIKEQSPYLLQHAYNPVDWYPWGEEAFAKAKAEDKPVFLSIGYSTCHWCHVMAHECFEDEDVALALNRHFISIKVDREERPDVDAIYMAVCQAFTGSGGWPLSLFLTPEQKPFFAGTYFPKEGGRGQMGFVELLTAITEAWQGEREALLRSADKIVDFVRQAESSRLQPRAEGAEAVTKKAVDWFTGHFDQAYGGFGSAPKFPMGHQLLFLLDYHGATGDAKALAMAEDTLAQMYKGGIFDHVGYGFCRYSTDRRFLVPHFEKMLYDNALLILAYTRAGALTGSPFYERAARQAADYLLREMRGPQGGFCSAQDADSEGEEGKYYTFSYAEILGLLGEEDGRAFCAYYGISPLGNFEGKSIPNLLHDPQPQEGMEELRQKVYAYRLGRYPLHLDDKALAAWNGLAIAALANLSQVAGEDSYLQAAQAAADFLAENLMEDGGLRVSFRAGQKGGPGFLEDYGFCGLGLMALYDATLERDYLNKALALAQRAIRDFYDEEKDGFYLSGKANERLIFSPKPTYDGALPSGNAAMAHLLLGLSNRTLDPQVQAYAHKQMAFLSAEAQDQPASYSFFLSAFLAELYPPTKVVCVAAEPGAGEKLRGRIPPGTALTLLDGPREGYGLLNGKTTYYICKDRSCLAPTNEWEATL